MCSKQNPHVPTLPSDEFETLQHLRSSCLSRVASSQFPHCKNIIKRTVGHPGTNHIPIPCCVLLLDIMKLRSHYFTQQIRNCFFANKHPAKLSWNIFSNKSLGCIRISWNLVIANKYNERIDIIISLGLLGSLPRCFHQASKCIQVPPSCSKKPPGRPSKGLPEASKRPRASLQTNFQAIFGESHVRNHFP